MLFRSSFFFQKLFDLARRRGVLDGDPGMDGPRNGLVVSFADLCLFAGTEISGEVLLADFLMLRFFDDVDNGIVFVFDDLFIGLCQMEFLPDVAKSEYQEAEQNEGDRDDEDRHDDRGDDLGDTVYVGISDRKSVV